MVGKKGYAVEFYKPLLAVFLIAFVVLVIFLVPRPTGFAGVGTAKIITVAPNKAPVANAGINKICYINQPCTFDGSKSYDPDGSINSYTWYFFKGETTVIAETSAGEKISHAYKNAGRYAVSLKVTDTKGLYSFAKIRVTVMKAR